MGVVLLPPKVAAMEVLPPPLSDKYYLVLGALGAQSTQQKHKKSYGIDAVIMPWLIAGGDLFTQSIVPQRDTGQVAPSAKNMAVHKKNTTGTTKSGLAAPSPRQGLSL